MVLVVEDEPLILDLLADALRDGGFAVTEALDGMEAQAALLSGVTFQALVSDVNLPGPLSGWDLARMARMQFPYIAILYATGHGELEWASEGVPGSVLMCKPFAPSMAVARLSRQLNPRR
jgi:DNA-binding response OmpR family regulator